MYACKTCGECCKNLDKSDRYVNLHNGNGVCYYLEGNKCSIYEICPLTFRIDEFYEKIAKDIINKELYYNLNKKACNELIKTNHNFRRYILCQYQHYY